MVNSSLIQLRTLLARQHLLQQQHQRRLAGKIHDDVSQKLTTLSLELSLATVEPETAACWAEKCQEWNGMVLELGTALREITNQLCPRILDDMGLVPALQWFARSCPEGISCQLSAPEEPVALPPFAANEVFTLCREIVTDFFAPNGVTEMSAELEQPGELLLIHLRVLEFKPGSDPRTLEALDALSIHERLACVDGAAVIDEQPGRGFAVTLSVQTARRPYCTAA